LSFCSTIVRSSTITISAACSTPSTCVQFKPNSKNFTIDTEGPGYRWLDLHADGSIDTGLTRIEGVNFEIDYSVRGY
jgi:Icc protein